MLAGTSSQRVALIGFGNVAKLAARKLREVQSCTSDSQTVDIAAALVRPERARKVAKELGTECAVFTLAQLLERQPDMVVECASQGAVKDYGELVLRAGLSLMVFSTGALADDALRTRLSIASSESGAQILVPAAAVAGLDGLGALKVSGLQCVKYTLAQPPAAWRLNEGVNGRRVLFTGSAREATQLYPSSADLVATVALAGIGFDATEVEFVVDDITEPCSVGRIEATACCGRLAVECKGLPQGGRQQAAAALPAAMSMVYSLLRNTGVVII